MRILSISLIICTIVSGLFSCKKEKFGELSQPLAQFEYVVHDNNVQLSWQAPDAQYDHFELELSKTADFSVLDDTRAVNGTEQVYRGLKPGVDYYARVRAVRQSPQGMSEWATVHFTVLPANILLPVADDDINGSTVTLNWEFDSNAPQGHSDQVTRVVLSPLVGEAREIMLTPKDVQAGKLVVNNLATDMQYTARIYNGKFPSGTQVFTTLAVPVNGVWTLNPYSDFKSAVEDSRNGDVIMLKPGTYNLWQRLVKIDSKSITVKAIPASNTQPKLFVQGFILSGNNPGLVLDGLDISGARLDEYKQEIPNSADTRWNNWLAVLEGASAELDHFTVKNSTVRNYWTGLLKMDGASQLAKTVNIDNCIVHHIGGDNITETIAVAKAGLRQALFTNSTFYTVNKLFISVDREKSTLNDLNFVFKNNTVDNSWSTGAFSFKELKAPAKVLLQNNIFSNIKSTVNFFGNFAYVANNFEKRLINCNFHNVTSKQTIYGSNLSNMPVASWELRHPLAIWTQVVPAFVMNDAQHANPNSIQEYPVAFDPGYKNPGNLDFSIAPASPLRSLDNGNPIGDPRWW